jgi:5-oxoprolinase (ATP-hydrolysing)
MRTCCSAASWPGASRSPSTSRVRAAFTALAESVAQGGSPRRPEDLAAGFVEIADQAMAEAIRQVTVARGRDGRDYVLVVFGAAGGQHACSVARRLGIRRILFHRFAGVLSAWGMGLADVSWSGSADAGRSALAPGLFARLAPELARLETAGRQEIAEREGIPSGSPRGASTAPAAATRRSPSRFRATGRARRDFEAEHADRSATRAPSSRSRRRSRG